MTMEKLIAVRFPLKFRKFRSRKTVAKAIGIVFFTSALVTFPMIFAVYVGDGSSCNVFLEKTLFNVIYAWIFWIVQYLIPLSTMAILNILIVKTVQKSRERVLQFSNNSSEMSSYSAVTDFSNDVNMSIISDNKDYGLSVSNSAEYTMRDLTNTIHLGQDGITAIPISKKSETKTKNTYKEKQMTKLFFAVTIPYFICQVPFYTRALVYMFYVPPDTDMRTLISFLHELSRTLLVTNCCTNFYIYMLVSENFRKNCKALFGFK